MSAAAKIRSGAERQIDTLLEKRINMSDNTEKQKTIDLAAEAKRIAQQLVLPEASVKAAITLLDEGNTVPFIARYRKDQTGGIDDQQLRNLEKGLKELRELEDTRASVRRLIDEQGKLTPELTKAIDAALTKTALEDIYRPYRPKRRTRASIARERGLEPLAELIRKPGTERSKIQAIAASLVNAELEVLTAEDAISGAKDIIAEELSDDATLREQLRRTIKREAQFTSAMKKAKTTDADQQKKAATYRSYEAFSTPVQRLRGHQILAMNRGEKEGFLQLALESDESQMTALVRRGLPQRSGIPEILDDIAADSWKRLIQPSLTTELRREQTDAAEIEAVEVFAKNLRSTLLASPLRGKTVLALDPGYRNGCKLAVTAANGEVLDTDLIYPVKPQQNVAGSSRTLDRLISRHGVEVLALGNGTATRETEDFVRAYQAERGTRLPLVIVNEAGASVYSASPIAAEEFPDLDVSVRGAISLARRLQDPLAELVKIEPAAIGVGQYQHDMDQKRLASRLGEVVEDTVNEVGVDLNTASVSLLSYISGINATLAKNIHQFRLSNGPFRKRSELQKVARLGPRAYEQCAGFLRIQDGSELLDNTSVHPESYAIARQLIERLGIKRLGTDSSDRIAEQVRAAGLERLAAELGCGPATLADIAAALDKPGRDSRADLEIEERSSEIRDIADLRVGMKLPGVVRNVAAFGAFVDIGVHQDGLVHISEMADRFVDDPSTVVSAGQRVQVTVIGVDIERQRISLSMKSKPSG